jgi:hypothetical protein
MFVVETNGAATECWRKRPNGIILEALDQRSCIRLSNLGFSVELIRQPWLPTHSRAPRRKVQKPREARECLIRGADLLAESRYDEALCMFEEARRLGDPNAEAAIARCKAAGCQAY